MSLTYKFFPELQDFNDIHKKIKTKIQEDIRFYNKFIENFLELSNKPPFPHELSQILDFFLENLSKIIKKTPFLFKTVARPLQANFTKILSKSNFSSLFQVNSLEKHPILQLKSLFIQEFYKLLSFSQHIHCKSNRKNRRKSHLLSRKSKIPI